MSNKKQIIEINGSQYDASTGLLISPGDKTQVNAKALQPKTTSSADTSAAVIAVKVNRVHKAHKPKAEHQMAEHIAPHKTSAPKTLMRSGLPKPAPSFKRQTWANGELKTNSKKLVKASPALIADQTRKYRALSVNKSQAISHFSSEAEYRNHHTLDSSSLPQAVPQTPTVVQPVSHSVESDSAHVPVSATEEILQRALERATAHEQKAPKVHTPISLKVKFSMLAFAALAIGVVGFIASQNLSGAKLQVASAEAGFAIKTPEYLPNGFTEAGVSSNPGSASLRFSGATGSYQITQKASSWSPGDLRDYYVIKNDPNYQEMNADGLTIYVYGIGNATWVNNGVWYVIQSNGALSNNQLVELATSL